MRFSLPAILFVVSLAVYVTALPNGFVWDDKGFILENPLIKSWKNIPDIFLSPFSIPAPGEANTYYYRPLVFLSFLLDYSIWGLNPFGYHLVNLIIHVAVSILIYLILDYTVSGQGSVAGHQALGLLLTLHCLLLPPLYGSLAFCCPSSPYRVRGRYP